MTQTPKSNLPQDAIVWGRSVEDRLDELERENFALLEQVKFLTPARDTISSRFAEVNFQIARIYTLIGGSSAVAPPPTPPAATYATVEVVADWSRTWGSSSYYTGSGTDTDSQALYQGSSPEDKIGMWHFGIGAAAGKSFTDVQMFMQNINSPYSGVFTAGFGTHGTGSAPSGKPGRSNGFDVGWARGEGKWCPIPSWAWSGLSNGSIQGFTVGGIGASNANYAFFQGVGKANPPRLKITYQN